MAERRDAAAFNLKCRCGCKGKILKMPELPRPGGNSQGQGCRGSLQCGDSPGRYHTKLTVFQCSLPDRDAQAAVQGKGTGKPREVRRWDAGGLGKEHPLSFTSRGEHSPVTPARMGKSHAPNSSRLRCSTSDAASEVTGSKAG